MRQQTAPTDQGIPPSHRPETSRPGEQIQHEGSKYGESLGHKSTRHPETR